MIVATAVRVFAYRGYDAATLREVADLVGITRPAVHHYFPGKAPLYRAALDRAHEIVMRPLAARPGDGFTAPMEAELSVSCALLGTSLAQSHRIAEVAPRIAKVTADLRRMCEDAVGPDASRHQVDLLVTVTVGRWVLTACELTDIETEFDLP
jgi:AcrR family transcriptional regulator